MIDLRTKGLPDTINVQGSPFLIHTDFRLWLKIAQAVKDNSLDENMLEDVFISEIPLVDYSQELIDFLMCPNEVPKQFDNESNQLIDYIIDGEIIVSSFMQVYKIDLTEVDMHWHLFKALLANLPDGCKLTEVIGHRTWKKSNKKEETVRRELKQMWELPVAQLEDEEDLIEEVNNEFYNC